MIAVHCPPACGKVVWWGKTLCPGWDTHTSNLGFQLTQLSQWERRRWNGKVERSAEKVLFNTWFPKVQVCGRRLAATHDRLRNAVGNLFKGKEHMKHHETNQKSGQRVQKFIGQVHNAASRIASPRADSVFVGQCLSVVHCPPACVK